MKKALQVIVLVCVWFTLLFFYLVYWTPPKFDHSYQSVIQTKYERYKNSSNSKIVLLGGSNLGFGIDEALMEKELGKEVHNLGLHAGFGNLFNTRIGLENLKKGDIVLLGLEYGWTESTSFDNVPLELIMSGIDTHIDMYQAIPIKYLPNILGYLPKYAKKAASYTPATGVYSSDSFNKLGRMNLKRDKMTFDYAKEKGTYGTVSIPKTNLISKESVAYLKTFKKAVEKKGARIYFISPSLYRESLVSSKESLIKLTKAEEKQIGIKYITNPSQYLFSEEDMFDTIYHLNSHGERKRTKQLIRDIQVVQ